jgi:hypothetical protein
MKNIVENDTEEFKLLEPSEALPIAVSYASLELLYTIRGQLQLCNDRIKLCEKYRPEKREYTKRKLKDTADFANAFETIFGDSIRLAPILLKIKDIEKEAKENAAKMESVIQCYDKHALQVNNFTNETILNLHAYNLSKDDELDYTFMNTLTVKPATFFESVRAYLRNPPKFVDRTYSILIDKYTSPQDAYSIPFHDDIAAFKSDPSTKLIQDVIKEADSYSVLCYPYFKEKQVLYIPNNLNVSSTFSKSTFVKTTNLLLEFEAYANKSLEDLDDILGKFLKVRNTHTYNGMLDCMLVNELFTIFRYSCGTVGFFPSRDLARIPTFQLRGIAPLLETDSRSPLDLFYTFCCKEPNWFGRIVKEYLRRTIIVSESSHSSQFIVTTLALMNAPEDTKDLCQKSRLFTRILINMFAIEEKYVYDYYVTGKELSNARTLILHSLNHIKDKTYYLSLKSCTDRFIYLWKNAKDVPGSVINAKYTENLENAADYISCC